MTKLFFPGAARMFIKVTIWKRLIFPWVVSEPVMFVINGNAKPYIWQLNVSIRVSPKEINEANHFFHYLVVPNTTVLP